MFSTFSWSQELNAKQEAKFNKHFFEAERYKLTDNFDKALLEYLNCLEVNENSAVIHYEIAGIYFVQKAFAEANPYGQKAVDLDPENKWYRTRLIEIQTALNNKEGIIENYKYLVAAYPDRYDYKMNLAGAYLQVLNYDECISVLNDIESQYGVDQKTSIQKKELYIIQIKFDEAQKELEKLSESFPNNIEYKGLLAQFYMTYGPIEKAEVVYLEMLDMAPDDPRAHLDLANFYRAQKKYEESKSHLLIAISSPNLSIDPKISVLLSFYSLPLEDTVNQKLAYQLLDTILVVHPQDPKGYSIYADFLSRDGKSAEAIKNLKRARSLGATQRTILEQILILELETKQYDSLIIDAEISMEYYPNSYLAYMLQGLAYTELKKYQEAIDVLETGLMYAGRNLELKEQFYLYLASAAHYSNKHTESDKYFDKALQLNPNNPTSLNNYAYYLALRKTNLERALSMTEACNKLVPNNPTFLDTWAWVLYARGEYNLALEKIELAIRFMDQQSADVIEHKGDILYRLGQKEGAIETWKAALKLGGGSEFLVRKIEKGKLYE